MKLPAQLLVKLSPLVEAARGQPLVEPALRVAGQGEGHLSIASELGEFSFDAQRGVVSSQGLDLAGFDAIQSVDIGAFPGGLGEPSWSVSLYLGVLRRITLGRTYDDGNASVVAAKIARLVGCKVVAVALRR